MSSSNVTPVKQPSIEDDAAREVLEDILRRRKQITDLMRTGDFQQLPLSNQVRIEHASDLFERALEGLARHHRRAAEIFAKKSE
jgi:hypothetical protein